MGVFADNCTARQCSLLRRKFLECSINNPALSLLMKHLVIGQCLKNSNFSVFHWSPRGSLVSIGQHFVATRVVHLPKSTKTSLITQSDQSGPNHQLLQLCTARTAWSESDQAGRAVHSCNSWLRDNFSYFSLKPYFVSPHLNRLDKVVQMRVTTYVFMQRDNFSYFSLKPYVVTPHLNRLDETVQMRGHNICFYGECTKIIPYYHQILPLI